MALTETFGDISSRRVKFSWIVNKALKLMNERFFLKLLLALFAGLMVAEVVVVALFGLRLELILLCFIVAAALIGSAFVVRLLLGERRQIETVSMRRAMQKRGGIMQERLSEYGVDEEFMGGKTGRRGKVAAFIEDAGTSEAEKPTILDAHSMERESFDAYIRRSMNGAGEDSEDGFSVELDGAAPEFTHGLARNA